MTTTPLTIHDLSESTEYFVICDNCSDSSTCESPESFALQMAVKEGFVRIGDKVYCPECIAEMEEESE